MHVETRVVSQLELQVMVYMVNASYLHGQCTCNVGPLAGSLS